MSDLDLIKQLENEIGEKLKKRDFEKIMGYRLGGYAIDKNGNMIGLNLFGTKLDPLPPSFSRFRHLKKLRLSGTNLKDISFLQGLSNLTALYLNINKITDISPLTGLTNLKHINLCHNKIGELPEEILNLELDIDVDSTSAPYHQKRIFLRWNPLEKPPLEIVRKGREAIKAYFESLKKEITLPLNEVKVLLVGDGGAGKTSLVKGLLGQEFDIKEAQTHGINIDAWTVKETEKEIKVNIWDFGGQEIMHATHQFFLSKRSLYILVLDGRKDEKTEYWLKHIES